MVISILGSGTNSTIVGSLVVLPSLLSPSSDKSLTSFEFPGLDAVTEATLLINAVLAEDPDIVKEAV